jgi:hypothetical protein
MERLHDWIEYKFPDQNKHLEEDEDEGTEDDTPPSEEDIKDL